MCECTGDGQRRFNRRLSQQRREPIEVVVCFPRALRQRPNVLDAFVQAAPLLLQALRNLRDAGRTRIEVVWVGPIVPYARVGGTVGRVFFVYKKNL